ncbi:hypothetical protein [Pseudomonas palleroniana]|uniref:hypothetical protein n=1 Tax=Pseudomonas palleroniana TaxID=191390 RepID=UPI001FD54DFE|nr:hypothetical protein [Pseudomonas palleroniana]UOP11177.1 hypothetical protein LDL65_01010 [Pseudomonas palleroniana]
MGVHIDSDQIGDVHFSSFNSQANGKLAANIRQLPIRIDTGVRRLGFFGASTVFVGGKLAFQISYVN